MFSYSTFSNGGAVFHGVTLPEYPARRFSFWVNDLGELQHAANSAGFGKPDRGVRPDSTQWGVAKAKAASLFRIYCK
jgi:hypothetical protein